MQRLQINLSRQVSVGTESCTNGTNGSSSISQEQSEYLHGLVSHMESMLGLRGTQALSSTEIVKVWIPALAKYPKYKLIALASDYRTDERGFGRTLADILRWLDNYQAPVSREQYNPRQIEPERFKHTNIARDLQAHYDGMMRTTGGIPHTLAEHEAKWHFEISSLVKLHEKYPHARFDVAMRARQDDMERKRKWLKEQGR